MQEIAPKKDYEPPEIRVIDPKRTSLVPDCREPRPIRKRRDLAIRNWAVLSGIETAIILIQWVVIYVLQAGPI